MVSLNSSSRFAATPHGNATRLDLDLVRKYSIPGPRYTSYPPATQFTTDLASLRIEEAIDSDNRPGAGPLSLYFHLPFCETRCWFCGCNTVVTSRHDAAAEYNDDLAREIQFVAAHIDRTRPVAQIHLGGGSPTFFPPAELRRLGQLIRDNFAVCPDCEYSVEVDPRRLTREHVTALREIGANRASVGIQDTDDRVQLAIHRWQPHALNRSTFEWLREEGFRSIGIDLIYGLPLQTAQTFSATLDEVLELQPDRWSVFSYAHVPWLKPAQKIFDDRGQLPSPEQKLAMFALAHTRLTQAGYQDIGLDHFARNDDELAIAQRTGTLHRNFQGYSTRAGASLYGFGMSAISSTADTYRQNHKTLPAWRNALATGQLPIERGLRLTDEDRRRRIIIMRLMCNRRLDYTELSRQFGIDFATTYAKELACLADLQKDGLLERSDSELKVTSAGVPLLRVIAMRFDETFNATPQRHAQTI